MSRKAFSAVLTAALVCSSAGLSFAAGQKRKTAPATASLDPQKQFVLDVVRNAVALPQGDPQDRLRVLHSAVNVVSPLAPKMAQQLSREGVRLEAELIRSGIKPAVSVFAAGHVDCASAASFVESLPATSVAVAEQSLLSAIGSCPQQVMEPARQKLDAALAQGTVAARPLLAVIDATGANTAWSQTTFQKMFASLPTDYDHETAEAPNFAAMYIRMAPEVDKDVARDAGLNFLEWLSHLPQGGERNMAVNMATDAMQQALGKDKYDEALRGNVVANSVAQTAGQPGEIKRPEEDNVSVLEAISNSGKDQTDALRALPSVRRAREAAADGFATGREGNRKIADHYFDIAFSAADEVWNGRADHPEAPAVVEEVCGAAAQVDAVAALGRAQRLSDPSAQAIGMLAVARTVLGQQAPR